MPEYIFEIVIILVRGDDELSLVKKSHSLYESVIMQTVFHHISDLLNQDWKLREYYTQNYVFLEGDKYEHG